MTILLIILLILLVAYLYWQNQQLKANAGDSPAEAPENEPWKEAITHLQSQINELKNQKDHDEKR